jgi:hypothetical protein
MKFQLIYYKPYAYSTPPRFMDLALDLGESVHLQDIHTVFIQLEKRSSNAEDEQSKDELKN